MTDKLPYRLRQAFVKAGYVNNRTGEPSVRALARDLDLNNASVSRYFYQQSSMRAESRQSVAMALGLDLSELDGMVMGQGTRLYQPPESAHRLNFRERTLVNDLINLLAERHREAVTHDERETSIDELSQRRALTDEELLREAERQPHAASHGEEGIGPSDDPEEGP